LSREYIQDKALDEDREPRELLLEAMRAMRRSFLAHPRVLPLLGSRPVSAGDSLAAYEDYPRSQRPRAPSPPSISTPRSSSAFRRCSEDRRKHEIIHDGALVHYAEPL
jgi:hypothetical protein